MLTSSELLAIEDGICIKCSGDDVECLENCTIHRCLDCGYTTDTTTEPLDSDKSSVLE